MKLVRVYSAALARFSISAVFLVGALKTILNWHETERNLIVTLCDWQSYVSFSDQAQDFLTLLTPWSALLLMVSTLFVLIGGLLVLLGVKEKGGAVFLVLFLIPSTILYHPFWFLEGMARELETTMFLKNLAILGGLVMMILHGGQSRAGADDRFSSVKL